MDGRTLNCGAVACVENIRHPAALARRVMERTPHVLLVGEGARMFALQNGFPLDNLHTPESMAEWYKRRPKPGAAEAPRRQGAPGPSRRAQRSRYRHGAGPRSEGQSGRRLHHQRPGPQVAGTRGRLAADRAWVVCRQHRWGRRRNRSRRRGDSYQRQLPGGGAHACRPVSSGSLRPGRAKVNDTAVRRGVHPAHVAFIALDVKGRTGAAATRQTNFQYASRPRRQGRTAQGCRVWACAALNSVLVFQYRRGGGSRHHHRPGQGQG